jgi:Periplasmic component of the Tol biopolymer transport system
VTLLPTGAGQPRTISISGVERVHNGFARFLPDGQRFALNAVETGHAVGCYVVDIVSGTAKPATPENVLCGPFSPDGRSLIGTAPDRSEIYSLNGSPPRPIPHLDSSFIPVQWSTDGAVIYGYRFGELPSRVYKVEVATGKDTVVQQLNPGVPAGIVVVAPVVVSHDGKRFAYSYNQTLSTLYVVSGLH